MICTSHWAESKHGDCIHALAAGWIGANDLCPRCTSQFMAALESATDADEPLKWHPDYMERAWPS